MRTEFQVSDAIDCARFNTDFAAMEDMLAARFATTDSLTFERAGDLRYVGQGYELRIEFPSGQMTPAIMTDVFNRFHDAHRAEYGHAFAESAIEVVNIRVTATRVMPKIGAPTVPSGASLEAATIRTAPCYFTLDSKVVAMDTPYLDRTRLPLETRFDGPAIIVQSDSTTVVPPRCQFLADDHGNLLIYLGDFA